MKVTQQNKIKLLSSTFQCTVYYAVQGGSNFWVRLWIKSQSVRTIQLKATEQYFPVVLFYYAVQYGSSLYRKKKELTVCTDGPHL